MTEELKPHQIAQLVNKLRDIAREFHAHGCLRELISQEVNSTLTQRPAAQAGEREAFEAWYAALPCNGRKAGLTLLDAWQARASLPTQPAAQATPDQFADASKMVAPVALRSVHLTRDMAGMCVVRINGRVAIRDNGDLIDHMATLEWFADTQQATPEPVGDVRCEGCGYMTHHREHMGCVRAAKQHTHPAPSVPEGVVLVPVEPTLEMLKAMESQWLVGSQVDMANREYAAMLAAAQAKGVDK